MSYNRIGVENSQSNRRIALRDTPWVHPAAEVRNSPISGKGLFVTKEIKPGEVVLVCGGQLFRKCDIRKGKARIKSITGFREGFYIGTPSNGSEGRDEFLNHSCDPNLWLKDEVTLVARTLILKDTEITTDYATWEIDARWSLPNECNCGSHLCRHSVTGKDWMLDALQSRYRYHFLPCLNQRIRSRKIANMNLLQRLLEPIQSRMRSIVQRIEQNVIEVDGSFEIVRNGIGHRKPSR